MNTVFELSVVDRVKPMYLESEEKRKTILNKVSIEMDTKIAVGQYGTTIIAACSPHFKETFDSRKHYD